MRENLADTLAETPEPITPLAEEFVTLVTDALRAAEKLVRNPAPFVAKEVDPLLKKVCAYANSRGYSTTPEGAAYAFAAAILEQVMLGETPPPGSGPGMVQEGLVRVRVATKDAKPNIEIHVFEDEDYRSATWNVAPRELVRWLGTAGSHPLEPSRRAK